MTEVTRSVDVVITVDTNKDTYTYRFSSYTEAYNWLDEQLNGESR